MAVESVVVTGFVIVLMGRAQDLVQIAILTVTDPAALGLIPCAWRRDSTRQP